MMQCNSAFNVFYERMRLYAMSLYSIDNLPPTCNLKALLNEMYYSGRAAFVDTSGLGNFTGIINTGIVGGSQQDIYGEFLRYNLTTRNGRVFNGVSRDYIVEIHNNVNDTPLDTFIQYYALKMLDIERTIDNNLYTLRHSNVWQCDESEVNTMRKIFTKIDNFEPIIFGTKKIANVEAKSLMPNVQYHGKELSELKANTWAEFLTFLGINNVETQKRAELKEAEVNKNNQLVRFSNNVFLQWWDNAIKQANNKWGLNMSLVVNAEIAKNAQKDGDRFVNLYNNDETG